MRSTRLAFKKKIKSLVHSTVCQDLLDQQRKDTQKEVREKEVGTQMRQQSKISDKSEKTPWQKLVHGGIRT
jgi:hypothetical protein